MHNVGCSVCGECVDYLSVYVSVSVTSYREIKRSILYPHPHTVCAFVLTSWLTWSVHGDLNGSVVSGHLWWIGEYCDCQCEALACDDIKQHQMTYQLQKQ